MSGQIFLSYSRKQFYFAEWLTIKLQEKGVSLWFDVQQIDYGEDWQADIDYALNNCSSLLLIASKASIASPYVEQEWRAVLAAQKPIYVVVVEQVDLPSELLDVAQIVDCRGKVQGTIEQTVRMISHNTSQKVNTGRFRLFDNKLLVVIGVLILSGCLHIAAAFNLQWSGFLTRTVLQSISIVFGGWFFVAASQFWKRQYGYGTLLFSLIVYNSFAALVYTGFITSLDTFSSELTIATIVVFIGSLYAVWLLLRSLALYLWLPTGEANVIQRANFTGTVQSIRQDTMLKGQVAYYRLHYVNADEDLAKSIVKKLAEQGCQRTSSDEAVFDVVIISNFTSNDWISEVTGSSPQLITLIAANIQLPAEIDALHNYQWFDFRTHSDFEMLRLARRIKNAKADHELTSSPESLNRYRLPLEMSASTLLLRVLGGINLAIGFFLALEGSFTFSMWALAGVLQLLAAILLVQRRMLYFMYVIVMFYSLAFAFLTVLYFNVFGTFTLILIMLLLGFLGITIRSYAETGTFSMFFPQALRRNKNALTLIRSRINLSATIIAIALGLWFSIYFMNNRFSAALELTALRVGLMQSQLIDTGIMQMTVPSYFDWDELAEADESIGELPEFVTRSQRLMSDFGNVLWYGEASPSLVSGGKVHLVLYQYDPQIPLGTSITGYPLPLNLTTSLSTYGPNINLAVEQFINADFQPLVEQAGVVLIPRSCTIPASERDNALTSFTGYTYNNTSLNFDCTALNTSSSFSFQPKPRSPYIREVQSQETERLHSITPDLEITRYAADYVESTLREVASSFSSYYVRDGDELVTHDWLIALNTSGQDFLLHIWSNKDVISWHEAELRLILERIVFDPSVLQPLHEIITVGGVGYEHVADWTQTEILAIPFAWLGTELVDDKPVFSYRLTLASATDWDVLTRLSVAKADAPGGFVMAIFNLTDESTDAFLTRVRNATICPARMDSPTALLISRQCKVEESGEYTNANGVSGQYLQLQNSWAEPRLGEFNAYDYYHIDEHIWVVKTDSETYVIWLAADNLYLNVVPDVWQSFANTVILQ